MYIPFSFFPSNSTYYGKHFGNLILCTFNLKQWFFSHVTLILCRSKLYSRKLPKLCIEKRNVKHQIILCLISGHIYIYMSKECSIYCTYNRINVFPHIFIIIIICSWVHKINLTLYNVAYNFMEHLLFENKNMLRIRLFFGWLSVYLSYLLCWQLVKYFTDDVLNSST